MAELTPEQLEGLQRKAAGQVAHEERWVANKRVAQQMQARARSNDTEALILRALRRGPASVKALTARTMLARRGVQNGLIRLEQRGVVVRTPGAGRGGPDIWALKEESDG